MTQYPDPSSDKKEDKSPRRLCLCCDGISIVVVAHSGVVLSYCYIRAPVHTFTHFPQSLLSSSGPIAPGKDATTTPLYFGRVEAFSLRHPQPSTSISTSTSTHYRRIIFQQGQEYYRSQSLCQAGFTSCLGVIFSDGRFLRGSFRMPCVLSGTREAPLSVPISPLFA